MSILDKFTGLFKREVHSDALSLAKRFNAQEFYGNFTNIYSTNYLLSKLGGPRNFQVLTKDEEIFSAIDKRIASLLDTTLVLEGESQILVDFFNEQLLPHEMQLKQDFWWTQFNGYGVEQIIYNENGDGTVIGFQREQFWRFTPLVDLIHVKCVNASSVEFSNQIMPYGKFVLTTNNGTSYNPHGEPLAEKLISPYYFKCTSDDLWVDFAKRFANGYLHAKIEDMDAKEAFRVALENSGKSSVLVTDKDTEIQMIHPSRDSSLYQSMNEVATKKIQRVILGETQTSDMQERGSSASATVHNEVRYEKTLADIKLIESAINETILQISLVNGFIDDASQRKELPKAKIIFDPSFNLELASRDATLSGAGVKFTKKYYKENYGFDDDDFEIVDTQDSVAPFGFNANQKKRTFLSSDDVNSYLGKNCCGSHKLENVGQKEARSRDEVDEIVDLIDRNASAPIDPEALVAAIMTSESESDLEAKLLSLFDTRDNSFTDSMTEAMYLSAVRGAMAANPEVIKE